MSLVSYEVKTTSGRVIRKGKATEDQLHVLIDMYEDTGLTIHRVKESGQ